MEVSPPAPTTAADTDVQFRIKGIGTADDVATGFPLETFMEVAEERVVDYPA